jgi:hypothetical protein
MLYRVIAEGTIARFCVRLVGVVNGGLKGMLTTIRIEPPPFMFMASPILFITNTRPIKPTKVGMAKKFRKQVVELFNQVKDDYMLIKHLYDNLTLKGLRVQSPQIVKMCYKMQLRSIIY